MMTSIPPRPQVGVAPLVPASNSSTVTPAGSAPAQPVSGAVAPVAVQTNAALQQGTVAANNYYSQFGSQLVQSNETIRQSSSRVPAGLPQQAVSNFLLPSQPAKWSVPIPKR